MSEPTPSRAVHRAARRLADGTHIPIAAYLAFIGLRTLAGDPPGAMRVTLPDWLVVTWALVLVAGAALIAFGTATDRTRAESSGHVLHIAAVLIYSTTTAVVTGTTLIVVLTLAAVSLIRLRILARSRAARREAGRLLTGERR